MNLFGNLFKSSNSSKKSESQQSNSQSDETFILEPILTPSGLIDGDDGSDPVIIEPELDLGEDVDFDSLESSEDNSEVLSTSDSAEDLEPLSFVDSEDVETKSEAEVETDLSPEVVEATFEEGFTDDEIEPISFFDGEDIENNVEVVDVNSSDTTEELAVEENPEATEELAVEESSEATEELVVEETEISAEEN